MATYTYNNVSISNLAVVAIKIEKTLGVTPTGLNDTGDCTTVIFPGELSAAQKTALDTLMTTTGVDQIPANTGNTIYVVDDVSDNRATLVVASGLTWQIYPTLKGYEIHFSKPLTTAEKNSFKSLYAQTLKLKQ